MANQAYKHKKNTAMKTDYDPMKFWNSQKINVLFCFKDNNNKNNNNNNNNNNNHSSTNRYMVNGRNSMAVHS